MQNLSDEVQSNADKNVSEIVNNPVFSLKTSLRHISQANPEIPPVVPDPFFDLQTRDAVIAFQRNAALTPTGSVDLNTWEQIDEAAEDARKKNADARNAALYPGKNHIIQEGDSGDFIYIIQSIMLPLARGFGNISEPVISGTHDERCVQTVKDFQKAFGHEENGVIDKNFWNSLTKMYEALK